MAKENKKAGKAAGGGAKAVQSTSSRSSHDGEKTAAQEVAPAATSRGRKAKASAEKSG